MLDSQRVTWKLAEYLSTRVTTISRFQGCHTTSRHTSLAFGHASSTRRAGRPHVSSAIRVNDHAITQMQTGILSAAGSTDGDLAHRTHNAPIAHYMLALQGRTFRQPWTISVLFALRYMVKVTRNQPRTFGSASQRFGPMLVHPCCPILDRWDDRCNAISRGNPPPALTRTRAST